MARCQRDSKKNIKLDSKLAPSLSGHALQSPRQEPDAPRSSPWGIAAHSLDMKALLSGMCGKDHGPSAEERVRRWRQETACEELIDGFRVKLAYL